jgi:hypothetical protein
MKSMGPVHKTRRRVLVAVVSATAVLAAGGVAFAYWTTSGSGSGTAVVAGDVQTLTLHATTTGELRPGSSVPVAFSADNQSSGSLRVGTVHLVSIVADPDHAGCSVADFTMPDVVADQDVPAKSNAVALTVAGTLSFADTAVDQSACKGATLTLTVSSN